MNLYFIATDYQATLRVACDHMDDENTRRLNDELLNSSIGLLRSASSPAIAPTMLMRFYPIITRCNEPLEATHAHIDGMSCCGPPPIGPLGSASKLLSTQSVCLVLMRFFILSNALEHKIISSLLTQLSLRISSTNER